MSKVHWWAVEISCIYVYIDFHVSPRTREDTVRCIVASLTDDSSNDLADVSPAHTSNLPACKTSALY